MILEPEEGDFRDYMRKLNKRVHGFRVYRPITTSQRAMLAANYVTSSHGGARRGKADTGNTLADVAEVAGVSGRSIRYARQVRAAGSNAVTNAVARGELTLSDALFILEHCEGAKDRASAVRQRRSGVRFADCLPEHIRTPLLEEWKRERREWREKHGIGSLGWRG